MNISLSRSYRHILICATALTTLGLLPHKAAAAAANAAATADAAGTGNNVAELVVLARRRSESLIDVPLAISVVTAAKLQQLDIKSTNDLANFTPGLTFNNFTAGDARNDRGPDRPIIMRGLNIGIGNSAGASMFLDGSYVAGNEVPADMDIGAVEVLRGPQSVYFGRATLTGAVSYRTKSIPATWEGMFETKIAEQDERDFEGTVAGPLIADVLKVRVSALTQHYGGYVTNDFNGASMLGATSRNSVSGTVDFTPTHDIEFKGYVNYFRDRDGPAATAFIPPTFENCQFPNALRKTICGEIPGRNNSINYANLVIPPSSDAIFFSTPLIKGTGFKHEIGTQRAVFNSDLVGSWDINSYLKLTEITGYHNNVDLSVDDGLNQPYRPGGAPGQPGYFPDQNYGYTYSTHRRDFSQEVRLASDPNHRLSWTLGGNYVHQTTSISAYVAWVNNLGVPRSFKQAIVPNIADTYGVFGGVYYKLTDDLTLSAEAREQRDKISIPAVGAAAANEATFNSFSPRLSADYDIGGHRKVYVSYAEGSSPGGFNTAITPFKSRPDVIAQITQVDGVTSDTFREQKLRIGELGFKGNFADGKGYFDLNTYYGELLNQQIRISGFIPLLGFTVGATNNAGKSTIYGVEAQGNYNVDENLSLSATFAYNHQERTKYFNSAGVTQFGTTNFDGKQFAFVPVYSASGIVSYTHEITGQWSGFGNAIVTYRGKQFADDFNAAHIPGRWQLDLRGGVSNETYRIELFVKNLLNDQNYTGGGVTGDFGQGAGAYAFFGGWAQPRQVGVRLQAKF